MIIYLDLKHTFPLNIFFIVIIKVLENWEFRSVWHLSFLLAWTSTYWLIWASILKVCVCARMRTQTDRQTDRAKSKGKNGIDQPGSQITFKSFYNKGAKGVSPTNHSKRWITTEGTKVESFTINHLASRVLQKVRSFKKKCKKNSSVRIEPRHSESTNKSNAQPKQINIELSLCQLVERLLDDTLSSSRFLRDFITTKMSNVNLA